MEMMLRVMCIDVILVCAVTKLIYGILTGYLGKLLVVRDMQIQQCKIEEQLFRIINKSDEE